MTQGHEEAAIRHCPRCGGLMKKPVNSSFFWHAEPNHPRCDITNLADSAPLAVHTTDESDDVLPAPPPAEPPRGKSRQHKRS